MLTEFINKRSVVLVSFVTSFTSGIYLINDYLKGNKFAKDVKCNEMVAIVTGGNSGIGKEAARELARRGATVFILCRDMERCKKARKDIVQTTKNKYVYARECDLGCLDSVRKFAKEFVKTEKRLDILINNAGVYCVPRGRTKDGFEIHLGVNHLGHFLLTNLLLDTMIQSSPSRIVNVTMAAKATGKINMTDLNSDKEYDALDAYKQSKLANILFTKELAKKLKGTGVTANSVHPGASHTNLYRKDVNGALKKVDNFLVNMWIWLFFKSPICGSQTVLYAALDPDLENVTGKHFENCNEKEVPAHADDDLAARWLWAVSEKWTKLKEFKENLLKDEEPEHDTSDVGTVIIS